MNNVIIEPARTIPVFAHVDVLVLGGGPAGIAAAASASMLGAKVLLVERYGFLGGMGTAAGVTNFCGLHANLYGEHRQVVHGVATELLDRIDRLGGLNTPHLVFGRIQAQAYDTAAYKIAADALLQERGVDVLLHALAVGVTRTTQGELDTLLVETKSGRLALRASRFIDASGDGDLAAWAGAPYALGDGAGNMLYPSTMFRIAGVDAARAGKAWETIPGRMHQAQEAGRYRFPRKTPIVRPQKNTSEWRVNLTQVANAQGHAINGIDARELSLGERIGREQIAAVSGFLKEVPGFEASYIVDIAPQLGVRETRRVRGLIELTEDDVLQCVDFEDSIGVNAWPLELHLKGDVEFRWPDPQRRGYNQLPYRMLVVPSESNLWIAGRCASMSHAAQSAARVSGACFVMGEAAGCAAVLSLNHPSDARDVDTVTLQHTLKAQGAWLG
jgi:glycine/D-amino acid oxidase-like deaminating enzyme